MRKLAAFVAPLVCLAIPTVAHAAGPPSGPHPRYLVGNAKAALAASYAAKRPVVTALVKRCDAQAGTTIDSGYQGFDWLGQMSACAIAWHVTGNATYAAQAVKYWQALLDDRTKVGDAGGGATGYNGKPIVAQDSGYSMRTFGAYGALGLDWLHDAPGVDDALRAHAISRLTVWSSWYAQNGYMKDQPESNYFTGYFLAAWAAAIAVGADDPAGAALWQTATDLTEKLVRPPMTGGVFAGGDWIEGWEYGELATMSYLVSDTAAAENGYGSFSGDFARDATAFHLYATHPDGTFFDSGDHQDFPVQAGSEAMWGAILAGPTAPYGDYARQFVDLYSKPGNSVIEWAHAIAEAKSPSWTKADWTKANLPLSTYAPGTGAVLARSGWGPNDVWVSFQATGRHGADHQHDDAGHFEIARGKDALAIATADYGTWATWNTNALLVDDQQRVNYVSPNQSPFSDPAEVKITRYAEMGIAAAAQADVGHAYRNNQNDVSAAKVAMRDWVFVRPDVVVVSDRLELDQPSVATSFSLHTSVAPSVSGAHATADVGGSRLACLSLLSPAGAVQTVDEPAANAGQSPWANNDTYAPAFRLEETQTGATTASFLHVLTATASGAAVADASVSVAGGARVVRIPASSGAAARVVVVSDQAGGGDLPLPFTYEVPIVAHEDHVVFGLPKAAAYGATASKGANGQCAITVSAGAVGMVESGPSTAAFHLDGCVLGAAPMVPDGGVGGGGGGGGTDGGVGPIPTGGDGGAPGGGPNGGGDDAQPDGASGGCDVAARGASFGAWGGLALAIGMLLRRRRRGA